MKRTGITEEERAKLVEEKIAEIAQKQIKEFNDQKVSEYVDRVKFTEQGWKDRYYFEKFHVRGISETREFCRAIR